jgi:hypothetical protein
MVYNGFVTSMEDGCIGYASNIARSTFWLEKDSPNSLKYYIMGSQSSHMLNIGPK